MSQLGQAFTFAKGLYKQNATVAIAGYAKRDPLALLAMRPGRTDPYAIYERMRAQGTLAPTRLGNWVTTSHRVSNHVLRSRLFGVRPEGTSPAADELNLSFLDMNPPDHTRLRRLAMPAFSPKHMAAYRPRIEKTVDDLLDAALRDGRFDLVEALAAPLPISVITDLMGIPDADSKRFATLGATIGSALDGIKSLGHARRLNSANVDLIALFESLFELRRREPADDIVSHVVSEEGDAIKPEEMLPMCVLLLVAGFETTVNLIGNGVAALLANPDQWAALCADPQGMAPAVVEEVLRYDPPVQRTGRVALGGVAAGGRGCPQRTVRGDADRRREPRSRGLLGSESVRHHAHAGRRSSGVFQRDSLLHRTAAGPAGGDDRVPEAGRASADAAPQRRAATPERDHDPRTDPHAGRGRLTRNAERCGSERFPHGPAPSRRPHADGG